jgi:DMSO/TMAO reductase YedYZ molybdopterin-dependent catalytic subunit
LDGSILAYDMNLSRLSARHGYPVRAILPGLYGMMNPKWITEIERVGSVYEGYWQRNGWTNMDDVKTGSSIVIQGQAFIRERFRKLDDTRSEETDKALPIAGSHLLEIMVFQELK